MTKPFLKIYGFFLVFYLAVSLGRGFLPVWFQQNGFSYSLIIIYFLIKLALPSVILLFKQKFSTKKSLTLALMSEIALMLTVFHFFHFTQIYLVAFFSGITVVYFYLVYNTLFFENTSKDKRAFSSSLYGVAGPFLGVIIPLLAGFISQKFGFSSLFLAATVFLIICLLLVKSLPQTEFPSDLRLILRKNKPLVAPMFIRGIMEAVSLTAIPTFTLLYINKPLPYGIYFGYLAFVSVGASVIFGFISDKIKKRTVFLYPSTIITAFVIILFGFSRDLRSWSIISGIFSFISTIDGSFVTTVVLDKATSVSEGMIAREFLVGAGRMVGSVICLIPLMLGGNPQTAMIILGLIYLLFPFLVHRQHLYRK